MIDWKLLPYFLAVARHGSLRGGAEEMGATHATVRRHIEALEYNYGVRLFDRARDGLTLTAAGRTLLPDALEAEQTIIRGRDGIRGLDREAKGKIKISIDPMTAHLQLAPALAEFSTLYPDIDFEMELTYETVSLEELKADVSIRHTAEISEDVTARKLYPLSLATFASRDYIDRYLPDAGPKGEGLSWLGYGAEPELQAWIKHSPFPNATLRHVIPDPEMHLHMVRAGAGMSILSLWAQERFPELQRVPGTSLNTDRSTWIVLRNDLTRTRHIRLFVDFLANTMIEHRTKARI